MNERPITTSEAGEQALGEIGKAGGTVKAGIVNSLRGVDDIEAEIVTLVRHTVSNTLTATGQVATDAMVVVRYVAKGLTNTGCESYRTLLVHDLW